METYFCYMCSSFHENANRRERREKERGREGRGGEGKGGKEKGWERREGEERERERRTEKTRGEEKTMLLTHGQTRGSRCIFTEARVSNSSLMLQWDPSSHCRAHLQRGGQFPDVSPTGEGYNLHPCGSVAAQTLACDKFAQKTDSTISFTDNVYPKGGPALAQTCSSLQAKQQPVRTAVWAALPGRQPLRRLTSMLRKPRCSLEGTAS